MELVLYHGTDKSCSDKIIAAGFKVRQNPLHWLGHGIYFFTDKALAEWWTTNPTKKYRDDIQYPTILQCVFNAPDDAVLDLRKLEDCATCSKLFEKFYNDWYRPYYKSETIHINRLRCTFFDWLFEMKWYVAIIGTFRSDNQPYYQPVRSCSPNLELLNLSYAEVQVCIREEHQQYISGLVETTTIHRTVNKGDSTCGEC